MKKIFLISTILLWLLFSYKVFAWDSCLLSDNESKLQCEKEVYVETNIASIAHEYWIDPVLWWTFYVTDIQWVDDNKATVEFEDWHILFITDITFNTWNKITEFSITFPEDFYDKTPKEVVEETKQVSTLRDLFNRIINFFKNILK